MKIACIYSAFPLGTIIESLYDTDTGHIDGLPSDICTILNDPYIYKEALDGQPWAPTPKSYDLAYMAAGKYSNFKVIYADSYNHAYVVLPEETVICSLSDDGEFTCSTKPFMGNVETQRILFPQMHFSVGIISTVPKTFNYYIRSDVFNVFIYQNKVCYMTKDGIKEFKGSCDQQVDFSKFSRLALALSQFNVAYMDRGEVKYTNI